MKKALLGLILILTGCNAFAYGEKNSFAISNQTDCKLKITYLIEYFSSDDNRYFYSDDFKTEINANSINQIFPKEDQKNSNPIRSIIKTVEFVDKDTNESYATKKFYLESNSARIVTNCWSWYGHENTLMNNGIEINIDKDKKISTCSNFGIGE